jgi:glucokinase
MPASENEQSVAKGGTAQVIGFDVGGTKTAWGVFDSEGNLKQDGRFPTPQDEVEFFAELNKIISAYPVQYVGIGIAGTISVDHQDIIVCPNIPTLSHVELSDYLQSEHQVDVIIENDARCALIGEAWKGAAQELSSAVMITLGTGVGGAVMQKGRILPHPQDIQEEIGRLKADPNDIFPAPSGVGTVEALLGGRNLEKRLQIKLAEVSKLARKGDPEALEIWNIIGDFFFVSVRAIFDTFACKNLIVGGKGVHDLELYKGTHSFPCAIIPAALGELAGIYGAARLALDIYEEDQNEDWE